MRVRFEFFLAAVCSVSALLTVAWPEWIELLLRFDPDRSDGTIEWAVVAALGLSAVVSAALLGRNLRLRRRLGTAS